MKKQYWYLGIYFIHKHAEELRQYAHENKFGERQTDKNNIHMSLYDEEEWWQYVWSPHKTSTLSGHFFSQPTHHTPRGHFPMTRLPVQLGLADVSIY